MDLRKKHIGVLMGGLSAEKEVSLQSGNAILGALQQLGYEAIPVEVDSALAQKLKDLRIEVAFIGLHGRFGEDGAVQGLLEMMRIPYTGSGILASALSMNKAVSRKIFSQAGLAVPPSVMVEKGKKDLPPLPFPFPVVVKPCQEGSSVGVAIVSEKEQLRRALKDAWAYDAQVLIEEYIRGREIQVGILDDRPLGAIEIVPQTQFYSYEAKYTDGLARHIFPASLEKADYGQALELGLAAHRALGCDGATRVDFLYRDPGQFFLLEVNTLPGMTALSLLPEIARGVGIEFPQLVEKILEGARLKIPSEKSAVGKTGLGAGRM
jgi:D-alanine-D-alanine ligase